MSILRLLVLLNPNTNQLEFKIPGVRPGISRYDVAACLHPLTDGPLALAYYRGLDCEIVKTQLRDCLVVDLRCIAVKQKWVCKDNLERLRLMCMTAIDEYIGPKCCYKCHGTGVKVVAVCERCGGSGWIPRGSTFLAASCGVSRAHWSRDWEQKFKEILDLISLYEKDVKKCLYTLKEKN